MDPAGCSTGPADSAADTEAADSAVGTAAVGSVAGTAAADTAAVVGTVAGYSDSSVTYFQQDGWCEDTRGAVCISEPR